MSRSVKSFELRNEVDRRRLEEYLNQGYVMNYQIVPDIRVREDNMEVPMGNGRIFRQKVYSSYTHGVIVVSESPKG